ncbi:sex comb on midleg-like protein 1 isoform X1 [Phoca vitulina]|uniref:sex comb on midleg-like protein 1 isoform X1 n=2 Tax=Phoca vitulina TaxID=9720 RepID=UPI001395DEEE|nr:sex comb on midleg-like protein 1 isoform X1 [Phoca vitulina]
MCCFSGVGGLPDLGDQGVSQINSPASLNIFRPNSEEVECCCCTKKMSSGSSEVDVIRTRIPAYDDDSTVLYAYEPNTAYINNQESVMSDTSYNEEQQKTVMDVLTHCQVIYDAIQNLDKKFDVIHGKVSKIHRSRVKSLWQNRKPLGYAYKNYSYLLSRKIRFHKMKKKEPPSSFSYPESYSPTTPVGRPANDSPINPVGTPYHSEEGSPERDPESLLQEQEPNLSQSPTLPSMYSSHSYQPYFTSDDPVQGSSSMACYSSPGAHSTHNIFSPTRPSAAVSGSMLGQGEPSPAHNPERMTYPTLMENKSLGRMPPNFATSSPIGTEPGILKQSFSDDPSTWSVDEVIQFLKHTDPQTLTPIADLFRQHDIDGKALLLLKSDMMMKYMGLKLGTAVKLCHYIDRLKEEKFFNN